MTKIKIIFEKAEIIASLKSTKTAKAILRALPIESKVERWGDEIYFYIDVKLKEENAKQDVEIGDIAYWPEGPAFCLFFGKTPVSKNGKPRAYSPVNVFGRFDKSYVEVLKQIKGGRVRIETE